MNMIKERGLAFWALQAPGWLLLLYLVLAQGITAFSYDLGVSMGVQESAEEITEVGAAFWYGFALGDLLVYIPLLIAGLIGHILGRQWGNVGLAAALGITIYWPIVCLAAMVDARDAAGWNLSSEMQYWVGCLLIAAWGAWGLIYLMKESRHA
jgi:hypothetical protein